MELIFALVELNQISFRAHLKNETPVTSSFPLEMVRKSHLAQHIKVFMCSALFSSLCPPGKEENEVMHIILSTLGLEQILWIRKYHLQAEVYAKEHCENLYRNIFTVDN